MRQKTANLLDRFTRSAGLSPKRVVKIYTLILFFAPLLYLVLLEIRATAAKETIFKFVASSPYMGVSLIVAAGDFLLGYLCWLNSGELLENRRSYVRFMKLQLWSQLLVGNWVCLLFAVLGLRRQGDVASKQEQERSQIVSLAYVVFGLFAICFVFYLILVIKSMKG
ncbi:hypothetical protein [Lactobacillus porci]|uniref:hypothetical protein n=1 Tax=Lactobacillus porci TaxID=2012477 RepID=UPI002A662DBB|nr:hypothetical protein [Lactobacillus porci]